MSGPAPLEVYLLTFGDNIADPATGIRGSQTARIASILDQAVAAEAAGFTGIAIGEHHFSEYLVSAPEMLLSAIAARTARLRLCTAVTLLALDDPVRVAERLCLLDQVSSGRAEMVVARGVPSVKTWAAFGCDGEQAVRERTAEYLEVLLRLLTEVDVTWTAANGQRSHLDALTVQPRPFQFPRPPVWMGGGLSPASADLAAQHGLPFMLPSTLRQPREHLGLVQRYRDQAAVKRSADVRIGVPVHTWVHHDDQEAWRQWRPHLHTYAMFAAALRGAGSTPDIDSLRDGPAICGDPSHVASQLNALVKVLGASRLLVVMDIGAMPADLVLGAIELFGSQVLPQLENPCVAG